MKGIDIRILDKDFNLVYEFSNAEGSKLNTKLRGVSTLECTVTPTQKAKISITRGVYLYVLQKPQKIYKIAYISKKRDAKNNVYNLIAISAESLLSQRITFPPIDGSGNFTTSHYNKSGNAEDVMKSLITHNIQMAGRGISRFHISSNQNRGSNISIRSRFKDLGLELDNISIATETGWDVRLNTATKELVFDIIVGEDRSANNTSGNKPITLSIDNGTLKSMEYIESSIDYKSLAYVGGQGTGIERIIKAVNNPNLAFADNIDHNLFEVFIDARDIPNKENIEVIVEGETTNEERDRPMADILKDLEDRGLEKFITDYPLIMSAEVEIEPSGHFRFGRDYFLGDFITIAELEYGVAWDTQLIEVEEIYDAGEYVAFAIFGNSLRSPAQRLQTKINEIISDID